MRWSYCRSARGRLPESTRYIGQGRTPLRKALSDLSPDCLRIEIEDRAHGGEGKTVLGIGQQPLPRLVCSSRDFSVSAPAVEAPESILEDGQAQTPQPAVYRRVDDLQGQDDIGGKQTGHIRYNTVFCSHYHTSSASYRHLDRKLSRRPPRKKGGQRRAGQDGALLQGGSGTAPASGRDGGAGEGGRRGEERQARRTTAKGWGGDIQHGMSLGRSKR